LQSGQALSIAFRRATSFFSSFSSFAMSILSWSMSFGFRSMSIASFTFPHLRAAATQAEFKPFPYDEERSLSFV
jgi:hypothetical protein